jgi:molecular chaperone GrpE
MTENQDTPKSEHEVHLAELERACAEARAEAAWHRDQHLRCRADMENFRRRLEQRTEEKIIAQKRDLLLRLLPALDNLDRAICHAEQTTTPEGQTALLQGLRLTYWQFREALEAEGVTAMQTVGRPFDPHWHEAIGTQESSTYAEGTVIDEVQRGYMLGQSLLRPARVIVAALPASQRTEE